MVKRLKKLTVEEAQALPEDAVVLLQDGDGNATNIGYRHLFQNSGPNRGRWGWVFGSDKLNSEDFIEELVTQSLDGDIRLKGKSQPLVASFESGYESSFEADEDDEGYDRWHDELTDKVDDLPVGSILEVSESAPLGLKLEPNLWFTTGCGWTSDQEAEEKFFTEDVSIVTPEADSQL